MPAFSLTKIINYFDEKASLYGDTPEGSDWNSVKSQDIRISRLLSGFDTQNLGDIADVGCGFGRAKELLKQHNYSFDYTGYEVSEIAFLSAKKLHPDTSFKLINSFENVGRHDRFILSGVFNLKLDVPDDLWEAYIFESLQQLYLKANFGLAVNFLSTYSDLEFRKNSLYYANPLKLFDFVKSNISSQVKLDHSYGLWDFAIHIEKEVRRP
jgi:SAM-dependent methyltransferase